MPRAGFCARSDSAEAVPASDLTLLRAYRSTTWTISLPGGAVELRVGDTLPSSAAIAPGFVITAYNPSSNLASHEENLAAHALLEMELAGSAASIHPSWAEGTGAAAPLWKEPGFLVRGLSRARAVALGERYGQNAIVWIGEDGRVVLLGTRRGFCGCNPGDPLPSV
jgi:hypothetical protein